MTAVIHEYIVGGMRYVVGLILQYGIVLLLQYSTKEYAKLFYHYHRDNCMLGRNSDCVFPLEHYLSNNSLSNAEQKNFFGYKEINISKQNVKEFSTYSEA